ncbi:hypothetical protein H1Z61_04755 [Bacillus aquiflavi]|uniref:Carbamoyl-phosphate synthase small subunit N-terminal domain-containing protein n=2 Tax=Bacillus aquiflavi TaxID=2672567 RepID=A0A6B3VYY8_9BACI|nr:carbamoyl-phosphate synthase domain-containing protein [Bacillus aquiflavi]MBA4536473.1 hypothetical protein [Bacillus aquiflavi]NEY80841.1 hypothetical protein [Bacillus aquiflavi]
MTGFIQLSTGDFYEGILLTNSLEQDLAGEIKCYTQMTGYENVLTNPDYENKIVVFTYPLIGNVGIRAQTFESGKPTIAGAVVYEAADQVFHYQGTCTLQQYLDKWNIPLLSHIDTRAVVKKIREEQNVSCVLTTSMNEKNRRSIAYA